ncbi:MAG: hypothetical protein WC486_04515 [Candidatus Omnitrophota bacterium]|jgi:hypothetical protein
MLKRHQVLLEDWQAEYLRSVAEAHDISISEALRVVLSMGAISVVKLLHPQYKCGLKIDAIKKTLAKTVLSPLSMDQIHKDISSIYFEARKATEYRVLKLKGKSKNIRYR